MFERTSIRKKVVDLLTNQTAAQARVSSNRITAIDDKTEFPYISVTIKEEDIEKFTEAPRSLLRIAHLEVVCWDEGNTEEEASDRVDSLCEQIENRLSLFACDRTITQWDDLILTGSIELDTDQNGEQFFMSATMTFDVKYTRQTIADSLTQAPNDFNRTRVNWRIGHNGDQTDTVTDAQTNVDFDSVP